MVMSLDSSTPITRVPSANSTSSNGVLKKGLTSSLDRAPCGNRRFERYQVWYRRLGSKVFAIGMHAVVGLHDIADTQCGFKFFRRDVALDIFGRQRIDGYMFDVEILQLATRSAYRIAQVPVRWRDDGDSRLQLIRGNLRNFKDILRIGWSRLRTTLPSRTATEPTKVTDKRQR